MAAVLVQNEDGKFARPFGPCDSNDKQDRESAGTGNRPEKVATTRSSQVGKGTDPLKQV